MLFRNRKITAKQDAKQDAKQAISEPCAALADNGTIDIHQWAAQRGKDVPSEDMRARLAAMNEARRNMPALQQAPLPRHAPRRAA